MTLIRHEFANATATDSPFDIRPVAGRIGAEIRGVDLARDTADAATLAGLRDALLRHKVIFFRGQDALDDAAHEAFAARLGEPVAHPTVPVASGSRYLLDLESREGEAASSWHTDVTFVPAYPQASILRAITVPAAGGDTLWANAVTAYETLPAPLRALADQLRAVHSNLYDYAAARPQGVSSEASRRYHEVFTATVYETEHPVVRVHPETGERALLLGHFVQKLVGLGQADSHRIFAALQEHATLPENTVRWHWQPGDVAIWDNRATQHRAIADFGKQPRHLRRATVAGDVPVGIDGRPSRAIKPVPVDAAAAA